MEAEASLRTVLETYTRLASKRQARGLTVSQLLYFHKAGVALCRLTGRPTAEAAVVHATQLLGEVVAGDARQGPTSSPEFVAELTFRPPPPSARPEAPVRSVPPCSWCGHPLSTADVRASADRHTSCRSAECLDCGQVFPKARLVKLRCAKCVAAQKRKERKERKERQQREAEAATRSRRKARATRTMRLAREQTPMELANRQRQKEERRQARLLSQIAPGPTSKQPPRAVIVRGGLPGLGARRR